MSYPTCRQDPGRTCSKTCTSRCSGDSGEIEDYTPPKGSTVGRPKGSHILVNPLAVTKSSEDVVKLSGSIRGRLPSPTLASSRSIISAPLLWTDTPLSFWGGTDPATGEIIDRHHPLSSRSLSGVALCMPSGRGSCSGSLALLELLLAGKGPRVILLQQADDILALGGIVAEILFGCGIPVAVVDPDMADTLRMGREIVIDLVNSRMEVIPLDPSRSLRTRRIIRLPSLGSLTAPDLTHSEQALLSGARGPAAQQAMQIILHMATMWRSPSLLSVSSSHIDCCLYTGPASLLFAQHFASLGGRFAVPTTLNAISVDLSAWRAQGVDPGQGEPSAAIAQAYLSMGAKEDSLTCAPYLLDSPDQPVPRLGYHIGWAESNAVVYANSVLGARTQKYPDLLDVCIALTGRAPRAGCHLDENRKPTLVFVLADSLAEAAKTEDALWPLLGYHLGGVSGSAIPIVCGLEQTQPRKSDLKAFCAAFATTSSAPMVHVRGITPEAPVEDTELRELISNLRSFQITRRDLRQTCDSLNPHGDAATGLVALGNPHFTLDEFERLSTLLSNPPFAGRRVTIPLLITCGRHVKRLAHTAGYIQIIENAGGQIILDTCWCMITSPVIPKLVGRIMTNSAKYAHYGAGITGREMAFGSLKECVEVAFTGKRGQEVPFWIAD